MPQKLPILKYLYILSSADRHTVLMPIVLSLSEEIMLDDGYTDKHLADILHRNLMHAIHIYREELRAEEKKQLMLKVVCDMP